MESVLVVEDNPIFAKLIGRKICLQLGFEFDIAPTFREMQSMITSGASKYFAAILDLHLPDASDDKIVDFALAHKIPSIVFTAEFSDETRDRMLEKNIVDYVFKESAQDIDYVVKTIHRLHKNQFIKVMVVDDSDVLRKFIRRLLRIHRYQVLDAANGAEALALLEKNPDIKLIITDFQMPKMNGFELVAGIRKNYPADRIAIIGISGQGSGLLSAKFLKKGANDFICKPFVNEEFNCRITQNIEILEHIDAVREASNKDYLTGLWNRRQFFNLGKTLYENAKRGNLNITLAMIDIDHFKRINDSHGHAVGDAALKQVAQLLSANLREADIVSRYGGEEFCIMTTNMSKAEAKKAFERIRSIIENTVICTKSGEFTLTVSIGVTTRILDTLDATIGLADEFLYQAKQNGRNRVVIN
jgi:diguanylate cyclase (GGDEF)-like protein